MNRVRTMHQNVTSASRRRLAEILTELEVLALIRACSASAPSGVRNRALIAVLWRAGLRVGEALELRDVDLALGTVRVRHGQGRPLTDGRRRRGGRRPARAVDRPPPPAAIHRAARSMVVRRSAITSSSTRGSGWWSTNAPPASRSGIRQDATTSGEAVGVWEADRVTDSEPCSVDADRLAWTWRLPPAG